MDNLFQNASITGNACMMNDDVKIIETKIENYEAIL